MTTRDTHSFSLGVLMSESGDGVAQVSLGRRLDELTIRLSALMAKPVSGEDVWLWRDLAREFAIYVADSESALSALNGTENKKEEDQSRIDSTRLMRTPDSTAGKD